MLLLGEMSLFEESGKFGLQKELIFLIILKVFLYLQKLYIDLFYT